MASLIFKTHVDALIVQWSALNVKGYHFYSGHLLIVLSIKPQKIDKVTDQVGNKGNKQHLWRAGSARCNIQHATLFTA